MPRKKVKRSSKTTVKAKQFKRLTESMEKTFRDMPIKIADQTQKDLNQLRKQEAKIQSSLKKMQKQQAKINHKQTLLAAKDKPSAVAKKQLKISQKASDMLNKAIANVLKNLDQIQQQTKSLSDTQSKYLAIKKQLAQFDKEWNKQSDKISVSRKSRKPREAKQLKDREVPEAQESMNVESATTESVEFTS